MSSIPQDPLNPPVTATNVATAYPVSRSPIPKVLSIVSFFAALLVLIVHHVDHPITKPFKSLLPTSPFLSNFPSSPKTSSPPAFLALCYSGHVGTLTSVAPQNLGAAREIDPNAEFFYHIDLKDDYYHERTGDYFDKTHDIGALQPTFDAAKAVVKTFSSADINPPESKCHRRQGKDWEHYSHNYIGFYAANGCYEMIKHREEELGKKFEWVVSLRPDMNIVVKIPPHDIERRVHLSGAALALVPREMADQFFGVINAFEGDSCEEFDNMGDEPCKNYSYESQTTECLLIKWLKKNDIVPSNGVYVNRRIVYPARDD